MKSDSAVPNPAMKIHVEWLESEGVCELRHENVLLDSKAIIPWWQQQWVPKLEAIFQRRGKFPLLICVDGITIRPVIADEYGATAKEVTGRCASKVARYGSPGTVRPIIATEALKQNYKANLFDNRADALKFLKS